MLKRKPIFLFKQVDVKYTLELSDTIDLSPSPTSYACCEMMVACKINSVSAEQVTEKLDYCRPIWDTDGGQIFGGNSVFSRFFHS